MIDIHLQIKSNGDAKGGLNILPPTKKGEVAFALAHLKLIEGELLEILKKNVENISIEGK